MLERRYQDLFARHTIHKRDMLRCKHPVRLNEGEAGTQNAAFLAIENKRDRMLVNREGNRHAMEGLTSK